MMVSRFRSPVDIIGMTTIPKVWRKLGLSWGVTPVLSEEFPNMDVMFYGCSSLQEIVLPRKVKMNFSVMDETARYRIIRMGK